jgi:hypothetical protein
MARHLGVNANGLRSSVTRFSTARSNRHRGRFSDARATTSDLTGERWLKPLVHGTEVLLSRSGQVSD